MYENILRIVSVKFIILRLFVRRQPLNRWCTFSLGGLRLQNLRGAGLSYSQLVQLQLQHVVMK